MDFPLEGRDLAGAVLIALLLPLSVLSVCRRLGSTRYEALLLTGLSCGTVAWGHTGDGSLVALMLMGTWGCYLLGWMRRTQPLPGDRRPWQGSPAGFRLYAPAHGILWPLSVVFLFQGDPASPLFLLCFMTLVEGGRQWMAWVRRGGRSEPRPSRGW